MIAVREIKLLPSWFSPISEPLDLIAGSSSVPGGDLRLESGDIFGRLLVLALNPDSINFTSLASRAPGLPKLLAGRIPRPWGVENTRGEAGARPGLEAEILEKRGKISRLHS